MIEFMIIAAPRSGTTWASNWLTTDSTLCLHDPLLSWTKEQLDGLQSERTMGIACTAIGMFPQWLDAHPARKVILHRDLDEVDASLERIGMTPVGRYWSGVLGQLNGLHVPWRNLFDDPAPIYEYLLQRPFDAERHAYLRDINIQPNFQTLHIDRAATGRLMRDMREALH